MSDSSSGIILLSHNSNVDLYHGTGVFQWSKSHGVSAHHQTRCITDQQLFRRVHAPLRCILVSRQDGRLNVCKIFVVAQGGDVVKALPDVATAGIKRKQEGKVPTESKGKSRDRHKWNHRATAALGESRHWGPNLDSSQGSNKRTGFRV